jgi:molybdopterin synthase catalytic subunit
MILITGEPVDAAEALRDFMQSAGEGAIASFVGTVRGNGGVETLTLDHYPGFTEARVAELVGLLVDRHKLTAATVVHRFGPMRPGETILFAATSAPRRRSALDALDELIEQLKTHAPFWKKERRAGIEHWLEPPEAGHLVAPGGGL